MSGDIAKNKSKWVLITGASGGFGADFAKQFAQAGFNVILVARSKDKLEKLAGDLRQQHGVETKVIACDLSIPGASKEIYEELEREGRALYGLVNNAGFTVFGRFNETDFKAEQELMQVNMIVLTELTKYFLPGMVKRGEGRILNVASTAAFFPGPLMAAYYASKAYVLSFSEALASELEGTGVTVTALCPGPTATGFQQRGAMEDSKLVKGKKLMDSTTVVKIGYEALMKGKTVVVPGFQNRMQVLVPRFLPRKMVATMVKNAQGRSH
jgi:short-subunit dehydrogenase